MLEGDASKEGLSLDSEVYKYVQEVIKCNSDNLYKEGHKKGQSKQKIH